MPLRTALTAGREIPPDLAELCRIHEIDVELLDRGDDVDAVIDRALEAYERSVFERPPDGGRPSDEARMREDRGRLRGLVAFAAQAAVLTERAVAAVEIRRRADRLEAAEARLAGLAEVLRTLSAISHEVNNPLTALLGRAQILSSRADADPHVLKAASVIEASSQRVAELIRRLSEAVREGKRLALQDEAVARLEAGTEIG